MNLQHLQQQEEKYLFDMQALVEGARKAQRGLSDDEKGEYARLEKSLTDTGGLIEKLRKDDELKQATQPFAGNGDMARFSTALRSALLPGRKTPGRVYVESEQFKATATLRKRGAPWTGDGVEIARWALTEDPASGGGTVAPDFQPIVPGVALPRTVADLIPQGQTSSNAVPIPVETSFTNAVAPVLEGGVKPESSLVYTQQVEAVRKIAHYLVVSDELLDDVPAMAGQIDSRLRYGVERKEEQQILAGTGVAPELLGILNRAGLGASIARTDPQTNADALLAQIIALEAATGERVSGVVMNPLAWGAIIGTKVAGGEYLNGGPFTVLPTPTIWGREVALTSQITSTVALVGAFRTAAQIFRHGGIVISSTTSHADHFIKNLVAVRCELRLALAVVKPAAFATVTALTVP
jgi:HK97 family phage major capsid protein